MKQLKSRRFSMRFTKAEYAKLKMKQRDSKYKEMSAYIRAKVFNEKRRYEDGLLNVADNTNMQACIQAIRSIAKQINQSTVKIETLESSNTIVALLEAKKVNKLLADIREYQLEIINIINGACAREGFPPCIQN